MSLPECDASDMNKMLAESDSTSLIRYISLVKLKGGAFAMFLFVMPGLFIAHHPTFSLANPVWMLVSFRKDPVRYMKTVFRI